MEEAILETLKFLGPLKTYEVYKWLIGKKSSLRAVEKSINKLERKGRLKLINGFCKLPNQELNRKNGVKDRSNLIKWGAKFFKFNPMNRLVLLDVSGLVIIKRTDTLIVTEKNLPNAYRLLALKLVWQKDNFYFKFLDKNSWAFRFFPNWTSSIRVGSGSI